MTANLNVVHLIGRVGRSVDMRYTATGQCRTRFSLATDRPAHDGAAPVTDWHQVIAWGPLAEFAGTYLDKGRLVYVSGRLSYDTYEGQDGQPRHAVEVVARQILLLDRRVTEEAPGEADAADDGANEQAAEAATPDAAAA